MVSKWLALAVVLLVVLYYWGSWRILYHFKPSPPVDEVTGLPDRDDPGYLAGIRRLNRILAVVVFGPIVVLFAAVFIMI